MRFITASAARRLSPMRSCVLTVLVALLALNLPSSLPPAQAQARSARSNRHPALTFVKEIGVGRDPNKWGWMSFVAFSPDGTMVASDGPSTPEDVSYDLTIWSFPDGRFIKRVPGRPSAISSDWKYFATDRGISEFDSGKTIVSLPDKSYPVHSFSPDGRYAAESPASDRATAHVRVLELATGKQVSAFGRHDAYSLALSPDGHTLAAGYWKVVVLWNMITGERLAVLPGFDRYVGSLSFSPDGLLLAAGNDLGKLQIWDLRRQEMLHSIDLEGGYVSVPAFSPDGRMIGVGVYGTGTVWLIDVASGKIIDSYKVSDLGCGSAAFSPDGRFLITPSTGGLIKWPSDHAGTIRVFSIKAR